MWRVSWFILMAVIVAEDRSLNVWEHFFSGVPAWIWSVCIAVIVILCVFACYSFRKDTVDQIEAEMISGTKWSDELFNAMHKYWPDKKVVKNPTFVGSLPLSLESPLKSRNYQSGYRSLQLQNVSSAPLSLRLAPSRKKNEDNFLCRSRSTYVDRVKRDRKMSLTRTSNASLVILNKKIVNSEASPSVDRIIDYDKALISRQAYHFPRFQDK